MSFEITQAQYVSVAITEERAKKLCEELTEAGRKSVGYTSSAVDTPEWFAVQIIRKAMELGMFK